MKTRDQWLTDAYEKYYRKLHNYAEGFLTDLHAANDVVNETFIKLHKKGQIVDEYLPQWLHRVCKNVAINYIRKQQKYVFVDNDSKFDEEPAEETPLSEELEHAQEVQKMMKCLDLITKKQRDMVRLRYFKNHSYQEISVLTGQKLGNVAFTLHAAIKKLREKMEEINI